ncbi:MAG: hypothetical protein CMJ75_16860 [Planctomycetaceae bacterium]|nr:hypothetical protein [Planctomycetaceae bacterium]
MTRPQIAAVVTEYRRYSHAQHILDRFLGGYGFNGRHHQPAMDLVALYTDQVPDSDVSRLRAKEFPHLKIYPTIAETLQCGGERLAVDGVVLIGEHGKYPFNEKRQHLYPRYEFFQEIVSVFRDSGRGVPVFNDKHLSWNWEWAVDMVQTARDLEFPLMAGSSVPVNRRIPAIDMPWEAPLEEVVCLAAGGDMDGYGIHALEGIQSLVERRQGGETGVVEMHAFTDDAVWDAVEAGSWEAGGCDPALLTACLCRSQAMTPYREGFNHLLPPGDAMPPLVKPPNRPICARYRHRDGVRVTMMFLEGLVHDFTFAARIRGQREPLSLKFHLPPREVCNFFSPLNFHIEQFLLNGTPPFPIERNLLTTGLTAAGVESIWQDQRPLATPHLDIRYQGPRESTFWQT